MAAWELSKLPRLHEDFHFSRSAEYSCLDQAPQHGEDHDIHIFLKDLTPENPKFTNSSLSSHSFSYSQFLIDALAADCFVENTNLHPLINFPEKIVASSDTPPGSQSFSSTLSQSSRVVEMESASHSIDDFSSIRSSSSTLPLPSSTSRETSFKDDSNFQASHGKNSVNKRVSMPAISGSCTSEFVNAQGVVSTTIGTVPPPPTTSVTAIDAPPSVSTGKRVGKKRSRASRRPPTTVLEADSSNFRAMVQQLTGIPSSPFFPPSLQHSTFDPQLGSHGLGGLFPTGPRPTLESFTGQSSISGQAMVDRTLMQSAVNPSSLAQASYTYGNHPQANEVNPFSFLVKRPSSESQQHELNQPKLATNFSTVSEASAKDLNASSLFQSLGYSDRMAALLSSRDQAAIMPSDRLHVWDSKQDRSISSICFDELANVKLASVTKGPEEQFNLKPMRLDHLHAATDVDICSSSSKATYHVVDSWLSDTD